MFGFFASSLILTEYVSKPHCREKTATSLISIKLFHAEPVVLLSGACYWSWPSARAQIDHMSDTSARTIVELNIKYYRDLLKRETDSSKRQTIERLLAEEEAKLIKLLTSKKGDN